MHVEADITEGQHRGEEIEWILTQDKAGIGVDDAARVGG